MEFKHIKEFVEKVYRTIKNFQQVIVVLIFFIGYAYILVPIFVTKQIFPLETFAPNSDAVAAVIWICHIQLLYVGGAIVVGYDVTFISLSVHIILQLKLFKEKIKDVLNNRRINITSELNNCIRHQQFLFE